MSEKIRKIVREALSEIEMVGSEVNLTKKKVVPFNIPLARDIMEISKVFADNGYKLFLVGGAVRDAWLGIIPKDYDFATNALPDHVEDIMKGAGFKTLPTGKSFGVINVFTKEGEYEIATFRTDIGSGRRPDAVEFTTIDKDVLRRDLTINALFYDINKHEIIDLVGGLYDLDRGIIRAVGSPFNRFKEDPLRVLRAIRFAARFGSKLDSKTSKAIKSGGFDLNGVSRERVRDEFLKGIKTTKSTVHFLNLLKEHNLLNWVFPKLKVSEDFIEEKDPIVLIAHLLRTNQDSIGGILNALTYTNIERDQINFLINFLNFNPIKVYDMKKAAEKSRLKPEQIAKFAAYNNMDRNLVSKFNSFELFVTGKELQDAGFNGVELGIEMRKREAQNFDSIL